MTIYADFQGQVFLVVGYVTLGLYVHAVYVKQDRSFGYIPVEHLKVSVEHSSFGPNERKWFADAVDKL